MKYCKICRVRCLRCGSLLEHTNRTKADNSCCTVWCRCGRVGLDPAAVRVYAFSQCKALKHVRIPETAQEVYMEAFDSHTRVELPERFCRLHGPYCPENWVGY